jgi:hypothetical protein
MMSWWDMLLTLWLYLFAPEPFHYTVDKQFPAGIMALLGPHYLGGKRK